MPQYTKKKQYTAEQKKKYVKRNAKLVEGASTISFNTWHVLSQEGYRFAHNIQLTKTEIEMLESAGMPTFIINKVTPTIELARYFVTSRDPRWIPLGVKGDDTEDAEVVDTLTERSWYLSEGREVLWDVVTNTFEKSCGYFYIKVDSNLDKGKGEVIYDTLNPWNVYWDPMTRRKMYTDAAWCIVKDDLSRSQAIIEHPEHEEVIKKAQSGKLFDNYYTYMGVNFTIETDIAEGEQVTELSHDRMAYNQDGEEDDVLDRYRGFYKYKKKYFNVFINVPPSPEELKILKLEVQQQVKQISRELQVRMKETLRTYDQKLESQEWIQERYELEVQKLKSEVARQRKIIFENLLRQAVERATTFTQVVMSDKEHKKYSENAATKKYIVNATPFYEDAVELIVTIGDQFISRTKLPGKWIPVVPVPYIPNGTPYPLSMASLLVGKQREMNKSHQIIVHNANLGSNLRWMYRKGSIETKLWRRFVTTPGAILPVNPGGEFPKEVLPAPLSNAFVYLTEKAGADFHFLSGMNPGAQGVETEQHETFKGQQKQDEMGTRRIRDWVHNILDVSLTHAGRIYMAYAAALYTDEKVLRVHTEDYDKKVTINKRDYDDKGRVTRVLNDLTTMEYDIMSVPGSTLPSNREKRFQEALIMRKEGIGDDDMVIDESNIKDKKGLKERKTLLARTTNENVQQKDVIKKLKGDIETLERMVLTARLKADHADLSGKLLKTILDAQSRIRKGELKTEADMEKMTESYRNTLQGMLNEAEMDIKELQNKQG